MNIPNQAPIHTTGNVVYWQLSGWGATSFPGYLRKQNSPIHVAIEYVATFGGRIIETDYWSVTVRDGWGRVFKFISTGA